MSKPLEVKQLLDSAFAALAARGINVTGLQRSQLLTAIDAIEPSDHTRIKQSLHDILGEPVTDVMDGLAKLADFKKVARQAIVAKGTLVLPEETLSQYAQKIRAIRSYADLTFSGVMPAFILDPEPTGSTIVYMRPGATGDGSSWDNAMGDFMTAQASLSGSKNVIYMEEGVYPVTGDITLKLNTKIYGGFKANDHSWSSRNSFNHRTVLDAQLTNFGLWATAIAVVLDGLTVINARNTLYPPFRYGTCKNLTAQDCTNSGNTGGGFYNLANSQNLIAINCTSTGPGGYYTISNCQNIFAINCNGATGGGFLSITNCSGILALNCKATSQGGGLYGANNCVNAKIVNCYSATVGGGSRLDNNCKNFLIVNCQATSEIVSSPMNCQNYSIVNCLCSFPVTCQGGTTLSVTNKLYNFVTLNNKNGNGSLVSFYLTGANQYYNMYNCRADAAITFTAGAATNADIKNFYYIQNNNSETKFANAGTYPAVGNLPYDNNVVNQKYTDGNYGNFHIPADSVLAGTGYWEDGFSFGWDIDGKPRNATHCSIGCYEPDRAWQ